MLHFFTLPRLTTLQHVLTFLLMTGIDLKVRRIARRVRASQLAEAMRVVPSRISQIEATAVVTEATANRYLEALATFPVAQPAPASEEVA